MDAFLLTVLAHKLGVALSLAALGYVVVAFLSFDHIAQWIAARWSLHKHRDIVAFTVERDIENGEYAELNHYIWGLADRATGAVLECADAIPRTVTDELRSEHREEKLRFWHPQGA